MNNLKKPIIWTLIFMDKGIIIELDKLEFDKMYINPKGVQ